MTNPELGWAFAVALTMMVCASCGGRAMRTDGEATNDAADGLEPTGSGGDGATVEAVATTAPSNQASNDSSAAVGGAPGSGGFGETVGVGGNSGVAGFGGYGGGAVVTLSAASSSATTGGDWGGVPVPAYCTGIQHEYIQGLSCELLANCAGHKLNTACVADGDSYHCSCTSEYVDYSYWLDVPTSEVCAYTLAACVQDFPFEAGAFECEPSFEQHGVDACAAESTCLREAAFGDVELTEYSTRFVGCRPVESGFVCECGAPIAGTWFEVPPAAAETLCLDARDWCAGEGIEVVGPRECAPGTLAEASSYCMGTIECKQTVLANGQEVTRHEPVPIDCIIEDDRTYTCACPLVGSFVVYGDGSEDGCLTAAAVCAAGQ